MQKTMQKNKSCNNLQVLEKTGDLKQADVFFLPAARIHKLSEK